MKSHKLLAEIIEIKEIKEFLKHTKSSVFNVLDNDDVMGTSIQELGSDAWFECFMREALKPPHVKLTVKEVIDIYHAVQFHTTTRAVEADIVSIIKDLQDKEIPVIALTARGTPIIQPTLKQMSNIGIKFYRQWGQTSFPLTIDGIEDAARFHHGIIFCNGLNKGKCLRAFFDAIGYYPENVLMIDDKRKHLESVRDAVNQYQGHFLGLRYGYLDEKSATIDMKKAEAQIKEISHQLPDNIQLNLCGFFQKPKELSEAGEVKISLTP